MHSLRLRACLQAARDMLERLLTIKAISLEDISVDTDLQQLKRSEWFQGLMIKQEQADDIAPKPI